ncbi:MAG: DUF4038 domain-containing protein [Anaerolineae bacterium]
MTSGQRYADPFKTIDVDAILTHSDGTSWRVPSFWAGDQTWRVRFAPPKPGRYTWQTQCSDTANPSLHNQAGTLEAAPYEGNNPLLAHGPLRLASDHGGFEHADGKPFFWLGDTWWMGLGRRLTWPEQFQRLAADRKAKGFTVVQIVAGLYPDMPALDDRGANEAGLPWEDAFATINPAYFDMADLRIQWLVHQGIVPCIVGCWGYYLPLMGINRIKRHWRYLLARWGSYPVIWCLAGEGAMPYYLSETPEQDRAEQKQGWTEVAKYLRATDPYRRPVTIHPTEVGRDQVIDDTVLDFDMLQTGHGGHRSVANTVEKVIAERDRTPRMPVVVGEVNYEGILHGTQAEIQRLTYWSAVLSGASGYTYGANGLWQVNTEQEPYGPSPHGCSWGDTPWDDAYRLPGSHQLGLAKRLLTRYAWWRFEPHPEWVDPSGSPANVDAPFAAGIPQQVRIVYFYQPTFPWTEQQMWVCNLESGTTYRAYFWNPRDGTEHQLGRVNANPDGRWAIPIQPTMKDWVVVLESTQV